MLNHLVKTFIVQIDVTQPLQATFDKLDVLVAKLGKIHVVSIQDTLHDSEPPVNPHTAEHGYRRFAGEAAFARIIVFTRDLA